ncbi:MAG: tRNA lysidine(34) synthetase TilS [Desulfobacteraceae bacterium]
MDSENKFDIMESMEKKQNRTVVEAAQETIARHGMIQNQDSILVGISGGPDSVALLLLLAEISQNHVITLAAAHVNHQLRGEEADRDEAFVKTLAEKLQIPFFSTRVDVNRIAGEEKRSIEETARKVRYTFFREICAGEGMSKLALGHTRDDNAELILMNLLRGSGATGLSGIPPVREGWIIRPFMELEKQALVDFLKTRNQAYVVDTSNHDPAFLRNRIRNSLIPLLQKEYNPNIIDALNRMSRIITEENLWMENQTVHHFNRIITGQSQDRVTLSTELLNNLDPALARRVMRKAVKTVKKDLKRITALHIDDAAKLARSEIPGKSLDLPGRIRIFIEQKTICFKKEQLPLRERGRLEKEGKLSLA